MPRLEAVGEKGGGVRIGSYCVEGTSLEEIRDGLLAEVDADGFGPGACGLAICFLSAGARYVARELSEQLRNRLAPEAYLAVSCEGVIGGDRELERTPGAALFVADLPGVLLKPFAIGADDWQAICEDRQELRRRVCTPEQHRGQILLADPFTTPIDAVLPAFDAATDGVTVGGMASGSARPGGNVLILNDRICLDGAVGVGLGGAIRLETLVSQGCRPVGEPLLVTRSDGPYILELRRRPAIEMLEELLQTLPEDDLLLFRRTGLFIGVAIDETRDEFHRGDFLVRGLQGVDRDRHAISVGEPVRPGQTIQLHVRDAGTAGEDLRELLAPHRLDTPAGALLFSCNGRGSRMFDTPNHDVSVTREVLAGMPVAGFFAMGELGPVGGRTFIHGHTASLALLRPDLP